MSLLIVRGSGPGPGWIPNTEMGRAGRLHPTSNPATLPGRAGRNRTRNLRFWRPLLYQLSYDPKRSANLLPCLAMELVRTAPWTELLELQPTGIISTVLLRRVVTLSALGAFHRNHRAISLRLLGHYTSSFSCDHLHDLVEADTISPASEYWLAYSSMEVTTPAPTVRPPSRIANRNPSSIATGVISSTPICTLSPGITISAASGSTIAPVTSVVRM